MATEEVPTSNNASSAKCEGTNGDAVVHLPSNGQDGKPQAVVLQVQQAIDAPANFLKLLITKSEAFSRFRAACSGSVLLLAVVDYLASQISVSWIQQKAGEVTAHVATCARLFGLVARMLQRKKKLEAKVRLTNRLDSRRKGELVIAWLMLANREHMAEVLHAEKEERRSIRWESVSSKSSNDESSSMVADFFKPAFMRDPKTPTLRLDRQDGWISRFGGGQECKTPTRTTVRRHGVQIYVSVVPTEDASDHFGYSLVDSKSKAVRTQNLNDFLTWSLDRQYFPTNLFLEFTAVCETRAQSNSRLALEMLEKEVRKLAHEIKLHHSNPSGKNSVTISERSRTYTRKLAARLDALVPEECSVLEREISDFLESIEADDSSVVENYTALLIGSPGSGKSSNVLHLAAKFGLTVSVQSLSSFSQLSSPYASGSTLILIEEFETQFMDMVQSASQNAENGNSLSRVYNLLDGSSILQGCVVVFTANTLPEELQRDYPAMFRQRRISRVVRFPKTVSREKQLLAIRETLEPVSKPLSEETCAQIERLASFSTSDLLAFLRLISRSWKRAPETPQPQILVQQCLNDFEEELKLRVLPQ